MKPLLLLAFLAVVGCHRTDRDEPELKLPPPIEDVDITGPWVGSWESEVLDGAAGPIEAFFFDEDGEISGTFELEGSPYLEAGDVNGEFLEYELVLEIDIDGVLILIIGVLAPEGDLLVGQYRVLSGPYEGDVGVWAIEREEL
jgi:hypothetical protein